MTGSDAPWDKGAGGGWGAPSCRVGIFAGFKQWALQNLTGQTQTHVQSFITHNIAKFGWNCRKYSHDKKLQLYGDWNSDSIEIVEVSKPPSIVSPLIKPHFYSRFVVLFSFNSPQRWLSHFTKIKKNRKQNTVQGRHCTWKMSM